ncbi:MAG TPA: ribonuclease domain-containing protein [Azonexus sp.]
MRHWQRFLIVLLLTVGSAFAFFGGKSERDWIAAAELPPEGRETLALIKQGGPFPYSRDGVVFNNFEKLLPLQPRGYYREYTVKTPGRKDRGPRRIVTGQGTEYYYTADHYKSFRRIRE